MIMHPKATVQDDDRKFEILAEATASAIFIYQGTRFKYTNPAVEHLTGYSREELLGMSFSSLFPPDARKTLRGLGLKLQQETGAELHSELRLIKKSGEECWIDLTTSIIDYSGKPAMIGTAFDITDRKRAELLQDAVYRIAQAADRSKRLEDLFPAIHAIIGEVMTAKNFYIALKSQDEDTISYPYYVDEFDPPAQPHKPGKGLTEWILNTGKSLLSDLETQNSMEGSGEVVLVGSLSPIWLGVPLCLGNEVIGVMAVQDYSEPTAYGVREQRMLEFVSSQVAMAIQRKRAEEALRESEERFRRRAEELSTLYETARDLASQHDLDTLLNTVVDRVVALLGSPGCTIYLFDAERRDLEAVVSRGWPGIVGIRLQLGEGVAGRVAESLEPLVIDDYRTWEKRSPKYSSIPVTAVAEVPMVYGGELVGVLTAWELDKGDGAPIRKYTQADVDLLAVFAATSAGAVHNARLFEEARQRLVEIELLYQASLAASQIHSLHAVAQRIVDTLGHLMDWKGSIWVIEDRQPVLLAYGNKGLSGEAHKEETERVKGLIRTLDDGIVGWVCRNGAPLRTGDVSKNPYYVLSDLNVSSEMCVPLKSGGKSIGCINVESEQKNAFSEHDERLLTTLANQAAAAIENARLFEETRRRAGRQLALNTIIMTATRAGADLESLLNTALDQTLKAFGLDMGAIWLTTAQRGIQRVAARGVPPSLSMMMTNAALMGEVTLNSTIVVSDWEDEEHPFSGMLPQLGIHGAIVCPLMAEGRRIGGLAVTSPQSRNWSSDEVTFIEAIAGELGAAADRARLFSETRIRLTELEAVNRVSTALRLSQSIETMLSELLDETLKTLDTEAGSIWLFDDEQGSLRQLVGRGWCTRVGHMGCKPGVGIPGTVYTTSDILFSHEIFSDPITPPQTREHVPPGWSGVCVPVRTEQETIGVIIISAPLPREFDGENARLLVTLADMAGNAIHRMQLNERTRRHAVELEERVASRTTELSEALRKAQEADRLKSEFIANINHELRTPLTNLVLYYQMLRAQPSVKTQERLDVIGRELQRLRSLIENLLNLSRLDLRQVHFIPMFHDINNIIRSLVEDRRSLAEERRLNLSVDLQSDMQPVSVDEAMIVQAVSNLLTNALNYTPSGGEVRVRTMSVVKDGEHWVGFAVEDTGPGIAEEDRQHLFERFYRGKAGHTSGAPGTGLGLAIVKQVVDRHGGRIEVPEVSGQGAVFEVWLPADKKETG
ncbi:MAG: GAF domain-containing protein [Chloroflexi bacterium]|nr:GAF domain-containing protein [Chloroflexota bacterium]